MDKAKNKISNTTRYKIYYALLSFMVLLLYEGSFAQQIEGSIQNYIADIIENLPTDENETLDLTALFEDLTDLINNPLNLNNASADQLTKLHILNDFQIASILEYRKLHGQLHSVYELLYLPGFNEKNIEILNMLVKCGETDVHKKIEKPTMKNTRQQLMVRYQRTLEKQEGYKTLPDSVLLNNPNKTRYLGSADKYYARYKLSFADILTFGLLMEKDAGEEFFKGSNRRGFDFYSGFVDYSQPKYFVRQLVLGDYHLQAGQGLLAWSSLAYGKSPYVSDILHRPKNIRGNLSCNESRFMRGGAITFGHGRFELTGFFSSNRADASIYGIDSTNLAFSAFAETGLHSTPNELANEKKLQVTSYGCLAQYSDKNLTIGLNTNVVQFDLPLVPNKTAYNQYSFRGTNNAGGSINYRFLKGNTQLFGETALSNNSLATLNGFLLFLTSDLTVGGIYRNYQKGYYSSYSSGFGENSGIGNENGFYLGSEVQFNSNKLKFYADIFSFPWLKYQVNSTSEGNEMFIELSREVKNATFYIRYKRQEKPENYETEDKLNDIRANLRENLRVNAQFTLGNNILFQNRIEIAKTGFEGDKPVFGYLAFQDATLRNLSMPLEVSLRAGYFNAASYSARIYAYERDVLYAYSSTLHYGKGWRYMAILKWQASQNISFWVKLSRSVFPGEEKTGSSLNIIQTNHKTDVKVQAIARF